MSISQEIPKAALYVRCSPELHERLKEEAWRRRMTLNRLCVETLAKEVSDAESPGGVT